MGTDRDGASSGSEDDPLGERALRLAIVEALGDGFFRVDPAGTVLEVNGSFCSLIGYRADEVLGAKVPHPWWFDDAESRARAAERLESLVSGPASRVEFEEDLRTRDGHAVRVLASVSTLRSPDGNVTGFVGTLKDISDRAVEEERAKHLVALTGKLAPVVREEEVLDVILDGVMTAVELDGVGLFLPTASGDGLEPRRHRGMGWADDEPPLPMTEDLPPTVAFREERATFFSDADQMVEAFPHVRSFLNQRAHQARASLPLRGRGGPTAVLHLLFPDRRAFDAAERRFLRMVADHAASPSNARGSTSPNGWKPSERYTCSRRSRRWQARRRPPRSRASCSMRPFPPSAAGPVLVSLVDQSGTELRLIAHAGFDEASMEGWDVLPLDSDLARHGSGPRTDPRVPAGSRGDRRALPRAGRYQRDGR